MRYRSYIKWINLGAVLLIIAACKKDLPYSMKTGYYAVQDIRIYPSGSRDSLYYTAVGPSVGHPISIAFRSNNNGYLMWSIFDSPPNEPNKSKLSDGNSGITWSFIIVDYEISETSLHCYREYQSSPGSTEVFDNDITFTYIE